MPSEWDFSICFPTCYSIGVTNSQDLFLSNEQVYLNCHMYHNGQAGTGVIQMQIITDDIYIDTVTWTGSVANVSNIMENNTKKEVLKITDLLGRETKKQKSKPLIYFFDDGTIIKKVIIE
jgi:hypothetical protein